MSFAVSPVGSSPTNSSSIVRGLLLRQGLGREHVLDLGRADPDRERAERAVRRRCGCRRRRSSCPGWVRPSSGPITWTMPSRPEPVACSSTPNSSQFARSASSWAFASGSVTGPGASARCGPSSRRSARAGARARPARRSPSNACGRGDLVDEVEVDVEERRLTRLLADDVPLPDLLEEGRGMRQSYVPTVRTTLPVFWPVSTYLVASTTSSRG